MPALPEFVLFSREAQPHLVEPEDYPIYGLFLDYAYKLQLALDADDCPDPLLRLPQPAAGFAR